jgi:uncharacterized damage-inducible protein DinB
MNLETMRRLYDYHFGVYERLWASIEQLTDAQFVQDVSYSVGSARNHIVHLMSVDQRWFARVMGAPLPDRLEYEAYPTRASARADWDAIQQRLRSYVTGGLTEADLARSVAYAVRRPQGDVDHTSAVWEILVHVINHGTDHRAQLLHILREFDAPTFEQDMMVYWWGE